ncbi:hypothetical protein CBR_g22188 [Chara braunii]|uniref:Peptidase A2 domain-containing protein n=1 Tax=Chara braunii TaxID=69332 RepID=A0A388L2A0_CHABU|nr:hypothetical protein CBR_g22188 [Chara braunii]|eukprot:GBG76440.1 hypothetical protein CBR_g22188 [Chara braunii]
MVVGLVLGTTPNQLFRQAEREVVRAACQRAEMEMEKMEVRVELGDRKNMRRPLRTMRCVPPPFLVDAVFETRDRLERICRTMTRLRLYQCARQDFYRLSVEEGPFKGNWAEELTEVLNLLSADKIFVPSPVHWQIVYRNVAAGETLEGVKDLFSYEEGDFSDDEEGEVSLLAASGGWHQVADWVGVELAENMVYLVTKVEWRADENGEWNPDPRGHVRAEGRLYVSENGWREFEVRMASGGNPLSMFEGAWQLVWRAGFEFADPGVDDVTADLRVATVGSFELPSENVPMRLPPFLLERLGGLGPGDDLYTDLRVTGTVYLPELGWYMLRTELALGLGKGMATEEEIDGQQSRGSQGTNGDGERNEGSMKDRESAKPEGTREDGKDLSIGESSGKAGGTKRGPQENREGGNNTKTSPQNSAGATPKKTKVSDTRCKLVEIEKRTAEFKARLIEQMMVGDEEDLQGMGSREGRRTSQDEVRYEGKDNSHRGTPSKKGQDKDDSPAEGTEKAMTPPAIHNGASRLPATPKVAKACDGLGSLRERVLGWFDPGGMTKAGEKCRESKEGEGTSAVGEGGSSEGGLKRIVTSLTRALNKNQGYLADAKKKLTFDGANITEFLINYENLAALLKWTEEEKMDHLGQHVSWKETRNEMMRKYLKGEKMATEVELAAVQRKNYATYNDFLRAFTLVALRIPGITDHIMSKYFLRQFFEFDKDKILSAYQQTSKFEYTRDVDFSTVTDLAEKTVVTETLGLLKEGEVIDLAAKQEISRSLKGEILGPQGERINWNSPGGMRRVVILLNNLNIAAVEAEPVAELAWDQPRGRGSQVNFILEGNKQDGVNITTRRVSAEKKLIRDTVMEEAAGTSADQEEAEAREQEKAYGKVRGEESVDKVTTAKKKFRYKIPILAGAEVDSSLSELLGTMVSVSFQTMLQASPRLLKGLRHLLTRRRVVEEAPEPQEQEVEEAEVPQGVSNLQRIPGDLEDLDNVFADIHLSMPDGEGGEVMKSPPGTKLSFHALLVGKLKVQIGTHHTDALVDGGAEITLIRRDFTTITGCTVNKEVTGIIRGAGGEIPFAGYVTKCAVKAGIRESIWSF